VIEAGADGLLVNRAGHTSALEKIKEDIAILKKKAGLS
jgi:hypothetical protein